MSEERDDSVEPVPGNPLRATLTERGAQWGPWPASRPPASLKQSEAAGLPLVVEAALDFGSAEAEYAALRDAVGLVAWAGQTFVEVSGADARAFLHNMTSQGVRSLDPGQGAPGLILTVKGHIVADPAILVLQPDRVALLAEVGLGDKLVGWLDRYVIADDVVLADRSDQVVRFAVQGPRAVAVLQRLGIDMPEPAESRLSVVADVDLAGGGALVCRRHGSSGVAMDFVVARETAGSAFDLVMDAVSGEGGRVCGLTAWDSLRVEAGHPIYGRDFREDTLPQAARLDSHLDWEKGCYIGQEVVSRLKFRGHTNKSLESLILDLDAVERAPVAGSPVHQGDREVGWLTSVAWSPQHGAVIALAMVHRDACGPGTALEVGATERHSAQVAEFPLKT